MVTHRGRLWEWCSRFYYAIAIDKLKLSIGVRVKIGQARMGVLIMDLMIFANVAIGDRIVFSGSKIIGGFLLWLPRIVIGHLVIGRQRASES